MVALYDTIQELFNFAAFFPEDFHDLFSGQVLVKKLLSSQLKLQATKVVWIDEPEPIIEQEFHARRQQRNATHDREAK